MKNHRSLLLLLPLALPLMGCNRGVPTSIDFTIEKETTAKIHTTLQDQFIAASNIDEFISNQGEDFARTSLSKPNPVKFSWKYKSDSSMKPTKTIVTLSENSQMDKNVLTYETDKKEIEIYNLKVNTTYYYTISLDFDGSVFTSEPAKKTIEDTSIRNLYIDGVENVRDIGGIRGSLGRIKQGLLYRSAEFNHGKNDTFPSVVTELGKKELVDTLGIKSDIDLRRTTSFGEAKDEIGSITSSPLGSDVNWVSLPMYFGGMNVFTQNVNLESTKGFFEYLADETHYPAIYHCIRGTDRTGALGYALGAMLGMSQEQLLKDYLFSNFANIDSDPMTSSSINGKGMYVAQIAQTDGDTLADKAANYVMARTGVTESVITSIRNIFIEK